MILTVPSYVIPGTYGENVVFLADRPEIQGIELLFYYFDEQSRDLFIREKPLIASYGERFNFAVHMPDSLRPEHERLIELTRDLARRYILHPPAGDPEDFCELVAEWQSRYGSLFFVENLIAGDFSAIAKMLDSVPLCCDTGHLLRSAQSVRGFINTYDTRIGEIHLHGVIDGQDHRPFAGAEAWFREILPFLKSFAGVVNLEVFSIEEVDALIAVLREAGLLPAERS